ncbi:MAG: hypothetical protein OXN84_06670 [Albidovulum sp.]|nr:hypothetical protein [Albidovulum sp.]
MDLDLLISNDTSIAEAISESNRISATGFGAEVVKFRCLDESRTAETEKDKRFLDTASSSFRCARQGQLAASGWQVGVVRRSGPAVGETLRASLHGAKPRDICRSGVIEADAEFFGNRSPAVDIPDLCFPD